MLIHIKRSMNDLIQIYKVHIHLQIIFMLCIQLILLFYFTLFYKFM